MNEIDNIGIPFVKQLDSQTDYLHVDYMMVFFYTFSCRERESKRLFLTKRLKLQLYYIPLTDVKTSLSPAVS